MINVAERELVIVLRSGQLPQSRRRLRTPEGFCCLGVACHLHDPTHWEFDPVEQTYEYLLSSTALPLSVRYKLGWSHEEGILIFKDRFDQVLYLTVLNDIGFTFPMIADIINAGLIEKKGEE